MTQDELNAQIEALSESNYGWIGPGVLPPVDVLLDGEEVKWALRVNVRQGLVEHGVTDQDGSVMLSDNFKIRTEISHGDIRLKVRAQQCTPRM